MPLLAGRDDVAVAAEPTVASADASVVTGTGGAATVAVAAGGSGASDPADAASAAGSIGSASSVDAGGVPVLRPAVARVESEGVAVEGSGRMLPTAAAAADAAAAPANGTG